LNELGDVTGWGTSSPSRAWLYTDQAGTVLLPNLPGKQNGFGYGVNDVGQVAGSSGYQGIEPPERATRWTNNSPQDLGTLGTDSQARAINNLGNVVGYSYVNGQPHGFFWSPQGGMVDMIPGDSLVYGYGLNGSNQATGSDNGQAFRWQGGVLERLGVPSGWATSYGYAINASGQVAGFVKNATGSAESFAIYTNGTGWNVIAQPGSPNEFRGINDNGDAVGIGHFTQFQLGYVYLNGLGLYSLTDQIATHDWQIWYAWDINNAGQIVGYGVATDGSGRSGAVRLTPSSPIPQSAVSRKTHGGAGTFDVPMPLSGNVGVECRSGGATNDYQMIVNFANTVTVESVAVTSGTGSVGNFSVSGSQVMVNLTGVTNIQRITVTLHNVNDGTTTGDVPVSMGVLIGDVNGNAAVNASDVSLTKSQVGQAVSGSNFREDVNANGTISATDVAIVKSDVGTALPP
jgi:probable HAF family extracellular repeat protein